MQYLNDVRFDLRSTITEAGEEVAYISDSSSTYDNGIIVVDLDTGNSWRHLDDLPWVKADPNFGDNMGRYIAIPVNRYRWKTSLSRWETLYFGVVSGQYIYSVPTARLLDDTSSNAQIKSITAVNRLVQKGVSDGYDVDSNS